MQVSIIAALGDDRVIGVKGKIPWHLPADFKHFKELTMGHPVIMGRKTFESIGKPLPGRRNIVLTGNPEFKADGCLVKKDMGEALRAAEDSAMGEGEVFVIGGRQLFEEALPFAQKLYLTKVHGQFEGDTFFPEFKEADWALVKSEAHAADDANPFAYDFLLYRRK